MEDSTHFILLWVIYFHLNRVSFHTQTSKWMNSWIFQEIFVDNGQPPGVSACTHMTLWLSERLYTVFEGVFVSLRAHTANVFGWFHCVSCCVVKLQIAIAWLITTTTIPIISLSAEWVEQAPILWSNTVLISYRPSYLRLHLEFIVNLYV